MALIFVQVAYMSAIVLKIHVLPFSYFCLQNQQCICFVSGVVITSVSIVSSFSCCLFCNVEKPWTCVVCHPVQYLEQPSPMQTVVYCFPNLAGPYQIPHSLH